MGVVVCPVVQRTDIDADSRINVSESLVGLTGLDAQAVGLVIGKVALGAVINTAFVERIGPIAGPAGTGGDTTLSAVVQPVRGVGASGDTSEVERIAVKVLLDRTHKDTSLRNWIGKPVFPVECRRTTSQAGLALEIAI
jgi:hypothetical protein